MSDEPEIGEMGEFIPPEGCIIVQDGSFMMTPRYLEFICRTVYGGSIRAVYEHYGESPNQGSIEHAVEAHTFAMKMVVEQVTKDTARSIAEATGEFSVRTPQFPFPPTEPQA